MSFIAIVCCLCIRFYYHSLLFLDNTLDVCKYNVTHKHTNKNEDFHIVMWCAGSFPPLSVALVSTHSNWHDNCFQIDSSIRMYSVYINRFHTWHQFLFHSRQQQKRKNTKEYKHSSTHLWECMYHSLHPLLLFCSLNETDILIYRH